MYDFLGPYPFARIEGVPRPIDRQFRAISHGGQDGVTIWDDGKRSDQFTIRCIAFALDYISARNWVDLIKQLEDTGPVTITQGGYTSANRLYQVVRITPVEIRATVMARGPLGFYRAKFVLDVTVQPVEV